MKLPSYDLRLGQCWPTDCIYHWTINEVETENDVAAAKPQALERVG